MSQTPATAYPPAASSERGAHVVAPPPLGYPTKDAQFPQNPVSPQTKSRGDGFWKGCCAALCCCCMLDACF